MNTVILSGNVVKDLELKTTQSGVSKVDFSVAVRRSYKNTNGETESDFINVQAWRCCAENCAKYLHKGSKVILRGSIQTSNYTDSNGNKRYVTVVVAEDVEFIGGGKTSQETQKEDAKQAKTVEDDGLPF